MIHTYLDLSTGHLTEATRDLLDRAAGDLSLSRGTINGWPAMSIAACPNGWFMTVPYEFDPHQWRALPQDLGTVLSYARRNNVTLVRFDSDGDTVADLPFYEEN